uniref:Odorant-binding protein 2 n=1 Tax=Carposina sasakii TaxID=252295 RepID=A0A2U9PF26_CARSA|nr:odorant-binding protein 2 [Carposina sasakii]
MMVSWLPWLLLVVAASVKGDAVQSESMGHVTAHFGKALAKCREELGLTPEILDEFQNFWREDFEVVHRELGCALICMSNNFELYNDDVRIHHDNMHDYIKSFPKGEELSPKMVELLHNCEKQFDDIVDDCDRVVKMAACFKRDAKAAGIAPEVAMIEAVMEKY